MNSSLYPKKFDLPPVKKYFKHKKIRIGYFSADFREHPVSDLVVELLEEHNRGRFKVYAFYFGPATKDKMNLRIKNGVDHYYDISSMSDKEATIFARTHELDIAIDLGGYTKDARTEIFAMSLAAIQLSYLGFTATMGSNYMDYIIADQVVIPRENQHHYSESITYLPNSYMVNDSKIKASKNQTGRENRINRFKEGQKKFTGNKDVTDHGGFE